jgi:hypothetical protein
VERVDVVEALLEVWGEWEGGVSGAGTSGCAEQRSRVR